ncbi:tetratricopeptide repeat protein [Kitasatospora hibisci]|uniref:tetratricopeptide repeat protein n=1 Tax=Kitasatospora hibisci TaxID=3369522 RepID=UPI003753EFCC
MSEPRLALPTHHTPLAADDLSDVLGTQSTADFITGSLDIMDSQSMEGIRPERAWDYAYYAVHLHSRRLAEAPDAHTRAQLHLSLATRLARIGRHQEAVAFSTEAVARHRHLDLDPADLSGTMDLTDALAELARNLAGAGRGVEAVVASAEAVARWRAHAVPPLTNGLVAQSLAVHGALLWGIGHRDEAARTAEEATGLYRSHVDGVLADAKPGKWVSRVRFAAALSALATMLHASGREQQALEAAEEAVDVLRRLPPMILAQHRDDYAHALVVLGRGLLHARRVAEALAPAREAVEIHRRLAATTPDVHEPHLAAALLVLTECLDDPREALAPAEEALGMFRRLAAARPADFTSALADARDLVRLRTEQAEQARTPQPPAPPPPLDAEAVLLATGEHPATGPFEQRVAHLVGLWDADGRTNQWLATGTAFFILNCWSMAPSRRRSPQLASLALRDYVAACRTVAGGDRGWDAVLRQHADCPGCGQSWQLENLQVCTGCSRYTCYECQGVDHRGEFCEVVG